MKVIKNRETVETVERESGNLKKNKKRYNNYDLLRIIACIAVIIVHVSVIYKGALTDKEIFLPIDTTHGLSTIIWNTLFRFPVPCFVMLSGAFILSDNKNQDYKYFYNKGCKKIGIPLIIFSILFNFYNIVREFIKGGTLIDCLEQIKLFAFGKPYAHLWYLYMLVELYLLVPIIIRFKNSINEKSFEKVSWIFLIISCLSGFTSTHLLSWDIGSSFCYVGYFMIGYTLKQKYEKQKSQVKGIIFIILAIMLEFIIVPIQYNHTMLGITEGMEKYTLLGSFNPIILMASVLIFAGISNISVKKDLSKLSKLTFYIYIFHGVIEDISFNIFRLIGIINPNTNSNVVILLETIIVFILSYLCSILWTIIWNFINKNNKIYNKIDKIFKMG